MFLYWFVFVAVKLDEAKADITTYMIDKELEIDSKTLFIFVNTSEIYSVCSLIFRDKTRKYVFEFKT